MDGQREQAIDSAPGSAIIQILDKGREKIQPAAGYQRW